MARNATPAPKDKTTPINEVVLSQDLAAANTLAVIELSKKDYSEDRDLLNQLLGQAQMADAFAKFSVTVTTSKLAFVKESKLYQQLKGKRTGDGHQFSGTWEEFCGLLGRSREQIDEDIRNLNAMGAEALESMSKMGIGYRELRQYRRLPEDQKQALIEVAKAGDKEGFVELAEEIIARHAKDKEALTAQVQEAKANLEATDQLLADKNKRIDQLKAAQKRINAAPLDVQLLELQKEATATMNDALGAVRGGVRQALIALNDLPADAPSQAVFMAGLVGQITAELAALREEFQLPDVSNAADAQLAAEVAQWAGN